MGNFKELQKWLGEMFEDVRKVTGQNAPKNCQMTAHSIQTNIINCCAKETSKLIIEDLRDDYFSILADESSDVYQKEQLALCIRYVDKKGRVTERFLGIVHVQDTTSSTLKDAIVSLLMEHKLTLSKCRGQGYDGASNMKGEINGLKTKIMDESPSAHYIHCFAHQLQLTLVAVTKQNDDCVAFFDCVTNILNVVGISYRKHHMLREAQAQEKVLGKISKDKSQSERIKAQNCLTVIESFDFIFMAHLLLTIFGYTDELCKALQKRDQDIINAIELIEMTKFHLQVLREDNEWETFLKDVTSFCVKHRVKVPDMDGFYVLVGRPKRYFVKVKNLHRFHVEMFDEVNTELLVCMAALNPANSFAAFDKDKLMKLAKFYPQDFTSTDLVQLSSQLNMFIVDVRNDTRFQQVKNLNELSIKLVETKKHDRFKQVYLLLKLVLILPIATASVERVFSGMNYVKTKLRNKMGDQYLNDCLVTFIERDFFRRVSNEDIIKRFFRHVKL
ncbi:uncharacterized protein [Miscanthus floridulus]|uniref:uncharacterized protein n=1 Tax=Miscanthus floridulus TaxID=154761 RepID=UPI003459F8C4